MHQRSSLKGLLPEINRRLVDMELSQGTPIPLRIENFGHIQT
jgi:hypothetical protein